MRSLALILCLALPTAADAFCLNLRGLLGKHAYQAVSEGMHPALPVGECFQARTRFDPSDIAPGTIVTFKEDRFVMVFRVVATEGTTVEMRDGQLILDGSPVPRRPMPDDETPFRVSDDYNQLGCQPERGDFCVRKAFEEALPNGARFTVLDTRESHLDTFPEVTVPPGHVFALGDHRDNSADSRIPREARGRGFVAIAAITGVVDP